MIRIESLDKIKLIGTRIEQRQNELKTSGSSATGSLSTLPSLISGYNIESSINSLNDSITMNTNNIVNLLSEISTFINSQVQEYQANEQTLQEHLNKAMSDLDSIQF